MATAFEELPGTHVIRREYDQSYLLTDWGFSETFVKKEKYTHPPERKEDSSHGLRVVDIAAEAG